MITQLKFDFKVNNKAIGTGTYDEQDQLVQAALKNGVISEIDLKESFEVRLVNKSRNIRASFEILSSEIN